MIRFTAINRQTCQGGHLSQKYIYKKQNNLNKKYAIWKCNKNPGLGAIFMLVTFKEEMLSCDDVMSWHFDEDSDISESDSRGEEGIDI